MADTTDDLDDDLDDPPADANAAKLRDARRRIRDLKAELGKRDATIAELQGKVGDGETTAKRIAELEAKLLAAEEEKGLFSEGVRDADEIDLVRMQHSKLDPKDRPALAEYVKSLKADPSKAPKLLAPYVEAWKGGTGGGSGGGGGDDKRTRPDPNKTHIDGGDLNGKPTRAEWDAARDAARRGDGKPLEALKAREGLPVSTSAR